MARDKIIDVIVFGQEIGKLGYDINQSKAFFQYHPDFLNSGKYKNLFPFIFKRTKPAQIFTEFQQEPLLLVTKKLAKNITTTW